MFFWPTFAVKISVKILFWLTFSVKISVKIIFDRLKVSQNSRSQFVTDRSKWNFDQGFSDRPFSVKKSVKINNFGQNFEFFRSKIRSKKALYFVVKSLFLSVVHRLYSFFQLSHFVMEFYGLKCCVIFQVNQNGWWSHLWILFFDHFWLLL